ncbi:MAG TPA: class I SAM-dependent methyltransferase [Kiritimatiellia bacterium]|nr:class I SAM-dependent methyltransferase [Kiritimatiellia bacterium]
METYSQRILKGGRLVVWQRFARFHEAAKAIRHFAGAEPVGDLLDIGAADGIGLPILRPLARNMLSVNYYEEHSREFRAAHPGESVLTADARALPLPDGSYDVCTSFEALNCVPGRNDRIRCIAEIHRVLKPGGWFVCSLPIEVGYPALIKYLARVCTGKQTRGIDLPMALRHWLYRFNDVDRFDQGCHAGFNVYRFVDDLREKFDVVKTRAIPIPVLFPMNLLIVARRR